MHPINPDDDLATRGEAVREWAYNCNAPADRAWILHDYDVWTSNPRYDGPPVPHPEADEPSPWYERGFRAAADVARRAAQASGQSRTVQPVPGYPAWYIIGE
jgi:hypothetical protein